MKIVKAISIETHRKELRLRVEEYVVAIQLPPQVTLPCIDSLTMSILQLGVNNAVTTYAGGSPLITVTEDMDRRIGSILDDMVAITGGLVSPEGSKLISETINTNASYLYAFIVDRAETISDDLSDLLSIAELTVGATTEFIVTRNIVSFCDRDPVAVEKRTVSNSRRLYSKLTGDLIANKRKLPKASIPSLMADMKQLDDDITLLESISRTDDGDPTDAIDSVYVKMGNINKFVGSI